jgi:hypothetical protein
MSHLPAPLDQPARLAADPVADRTNAINPGRRRLIGAAAAATGLAGAGLIPGLQAAV